jgi:hypothetical protein
MEHEKLTGSAASQEIPRILFRCLLRDTPSRNTPPPPRRSDWESCLPPDPFVSRGRISTCECFLTWVFTGRRC